ncbi:MAG: hypothetical protein ACI9SP_003127 [Arenicella sp.]|jgi:hypothetical protein
MSPYIQKDTTKMKNFDSRTYSIDDFMEWETNNQLELSPKFQRRSVWSDTARSYLMDTIIQGKPMPKVFIRHKLNPKTRKSIREVVDGQQRLRTILAFMKDGFKISTSHNKQYGGLYFSELDSVDDEIQSHILNYEISVDLLVNMSDSDVLDVFGRLNSYSVTLNDQEKINANHFSEFKFLADRIAHRYNDFWTKNKLITEKNILRMIDVQTVAELLIGMTEGIRSKKQIKRYYELYEVEFAHDAERLELEFAENISIIQEIFGENLKSRQFKRNHVFYSLFLAIHHVQFGVQNIDRPDEKGMCFDHSNFGRISINLERVDRIFESANKDLLNAAERQFQEDCRRATTDTLVRVRRSEFIIDEMFR